MRFFVTSFLVILFFSTQALAEDINNFDTQLQKTTSVSFANLEAEIIKNIKISAATDDFIGVKNVVLNRIGSSRKYSLLQAQSSDIKDEYLLSDFNIDEIKQSFTATLKNKEKSLEIAVSGRYNAQVEVPVLVSSMSKGDVIEEDDIKIQRVDKIRLRQQVITVSDKLIGKKLARTLATGAMVSIKDIVEKVTIEKGKAATLVYKLKNIELKTTAEALENGVDGQIIKFRNISSDKIINAMVVDSGSAVVNYSNVAELAENKNSNGKSIN